MSDIYTVQIDGVEYDIEGDRPPTEAEARAAVGGSASLPDAATRSMMPQSAAEGDPEGPRPRRGLQFRPEHAALGAQIEGAEQMGEFLPPPGLSALRPIARKVVGTGLRGLGAVIERPLISGGLGALPGASRGDLGDAVLGGVAGAATGLPVGKALRTIGTRMTAPNPNAGGTLRRIPSRPQPAGLVNPNAIGPEELQKIVAGVRTPPSVTLTPSHPSGGGFTVPGPANPNAGGVLRPGAPRPNALHEIVTERMRPTSTTLPLSHPTGGEFTVPPNMSTRPLVTYSPRADAVRRSSAREPMPGLESNEIAGLTKRYRELSRKLVLTPDETRELATLQTRVAASAREVGLTYPAAGSPRNAARNRRTGEVMLDATGDTMRRNALVARMSGGRP